ncbi:MAG: hypothetical protein AAGG75_22320 [Bacteroidota bacterium]
MKNNNYLAILFCILLLSAGCFDYETQFEGPYEDMEDTTSPPIELPKVVVFVAGGKVYLADENINQIDTIYSSNDVRIASINNEHSKVAYKRLGENIQIYDIEEGRIVGEIANSENATWFDFHANNQTVYYTNGWELTTYGPEVLLTNPTDIRQLSPLSGNGVFFKGAVVLENGNIIYSLSALGFGDRLYLSTGTSNIASFTGTEFRHFLRINAAENELWAASEFDNKLHIHRTTDLSEIRTDRDHFLGAPTSNGAGYKVRIIDEEIIQIPFLNLSVSSPGDERVTSIDY